MRVLSPKTRERTDSNIDSLRDVSLIDTITAPQVSKRSIVFYSATGASCM